MERAGERQEMRASRRPSRELHRAFDRLCARVREEHARRRRYGRAVAQPFGEADLGLVVEVRAGHVDEETGLLLDRFHDLGMGVARSRDGDARGEVEELVAIDVVDPHSLAPCDHQWVWTREAGRERTLVARNERGRERAWDCLLYTSPSPRDS